MSTKIRLCETLRQTSYATKRGDTIIEVMFAIAVFSLVAVLTISMMNLGTAKAEGSLELTTARHELNAQAEALRFVHSAYTAELALPTCSAPILQKDEKCQQYRDLWEKITEHARDPISGDPAQESIIDIANTLSNNDPSVGDYDTVGCARAYEPGIFGGSSLLVKNKAFILNVRDLNISANSDKSALYLPTRAVISAESGNTSMDPDDSNTSIQFTPAPLGARIIYSGGGGGTTDDGFAIRNTYNQVSRVEGLWVVAIRGEGDPVPFYDFYIQTCWNAPNSLSPTILDTVIRLYNPGAK